MEETLSINEFHEWRAYDFINPIGDSKLDYNFANLILYIMTMLCGNKKNITIEDLVIDYESPFRTDDENKAIEEKKRQRKQELTKKNININQILENFNRIAARGT